MPFLYPERLRELQAKYPNTQFDGHGRVIEGTPLDQYNTQPANPAAIPASVRTYSQFDPATGTWIRHTNGAASVQSPVPAQGTPINFQQVFGYTPAGFEGATLNIGGRANAQPRQVIRPLARGNSRDISAAVAPRDLGSGVTAQEVGTYDYSKTHGNENPIAPLTQPGVVYPPARNLEGYDPNNPPVTVNQAAVDPMFTPEFNQRAINMSEGTTAKAINNARWYGDQFLRMAESMPTTAPLGTVAELPNFSRMGQGALNTARRILPSLDDVSAYASRLADHIPTGVRSAYDSVVDLGRGLLNRAGGFLQRPASTPTIQTYTKVRPTHNMVNPNARRSANYYGH